MNISSTNNQALVPSIKWASLNIAQARQSLENNKEIACSPAQKYSRGWILQKVGSDEGAMSEQVAQIDLKFYQAHFEQKKHIKINGCSREFFTLLLNLPLQTLKGKAISSHMAWNVKCIGSISSSLEYLSVSKIHHHTFIELMGILKTNTTLKQFIIKDFNNSGIVAEHVSSTLSSNKGLKILDLSDIEFIPFQFSYLMNALRENNETLEELKAPRCSFDNSSAFNTNEMILKNKTLKKLSLRAINNSFPEAYLPTFCSNFKENQGIKELNIPRLANFTWKQASVLAENQRLESLEICCTPENEEDKFGFEDFTKSGSPKQVVI